MGMSGRKTSGLAALIALAFAGLAPARAHAGEGLNFNLKGTSLAGNFGTTQSIPCGTGTSTQFTFVSWNAFEGIQRGGSAPVTTTNAGVFIQRNNNCTGDVVFDFAFVETGVSISSNGLNSVTLSASFPLVISGGVLTLNITQTATGNTSQGLNMSRSNVGPVFFMSRTNSASTEANNFSGTVALNGQNIPLVNLSEVGGSFQKNTTAQLLVIGARMHQ